MLNSFPLLVLLIVMVAFIPMNVSVLASTSRADPVHRREVGMTDDGRRDGHL